ncbi:MAG: zinc dependent phospholipase C family protein [Tepidiformaceae bacterium]
MALDERAKRPQPADPLMPPITLHMVVARQIALDLDSEQLAPTSGHYLLGATSPDIRVLTRQDRLSTHFFDLNGPDHQDSVASFFAANPRYVDPQAVSPETRTWVAGYISHLVMDEQYITGIYRKFFAKHDALGGTMRANVMDRLLQFDLDRQYGTDPQLKTRLCDALSCTVEGIDAGFVDLETLERWRQVSSDVAAREMDWERMRTMISNHLRLGGLEEGETLGSFLDSLPDLLNETIAHITSSEIEDFVERATAAARAAVGRYLGCG